METVTSKAIEIWKSGDTVKALGIFKNFKMGVTEDERRILQVGHEMQSGKRRFYESLGYNYNTAVGEAHKLVETKFINV